MDDKKHMLEERSDPAIRRWGFLITESVLIVASILFAFALDSWWDQRSEYNEATEILVGLKDEFQQNRAKLNYRIGAHNQNLSSTSELHAATLRGSWESTDLTVDAALAALVTPPTTDLGTGVLDALISAGRLELLDNKRLRVLLASWAGVFGEVHDDEIMGRTFVFDQVLPYLMRRGVPMSGPMSTWSEQWPVEIRSVADDPEALARLLADPAFSVMLEVRIGFNTHLTGEYEAALDAVDDILDQIESSLAERSI